MQATHERTVLEKAEKFIEASNMNLFYGFAQSDIEKIQAAFQGLIQNGETTFPDFSNAEACVELFAISSSEQGKRGGPAQMIQDGKLRSQIKRDDKMAAIGRDYSPRTYTAIHPCHSYGALCSSLRSGFCNHLNSLRNCEKRYSTKVFVVEYPECDLECAFTPSESVNYNNLYMGDLTPVYSDGKMHGPYRLSRDKENLEWLFGAAQDIDYVVFIGFQHIEAINVRNIDAIEAFLPWRLHAVSNISMTVASSCYVGSAVKEASDEQD